MSKITVVGLKPFAGVGKESGKPYSMLIASCVCTDNDGVVTVGEVQFFEGTNRPLPKLAVGHSYEPIVSFSAKSGKIITEITELRPLVPAVKAA
jgi:hypothetical protein